MKLKSYLIFFCLMLSMSSAWAFSWSDFWLRPDQQGSKALQAGQPLLAANLFQNTDWRGVAYYRAGKYQQAYQLFKQDQTAKGFYNQGNALAHMGQYQQALNAYDQAIGQQPDFTAAKYNKALVEKLLQQPKDKSQSQDNKTADNSTSKTGSSTPKQPATGGQQPPATGNQNAPSAPDNQQQNNNQGTPQQQAQQQRQTNNSPNKTTSDTSKQAQNNSPASATDSASPENNTAGNQAQKNNAPVKPTSQQQTPQQVSNQWLQSIPDDPGGLLQQKFLRDHANYQQLQQQGQQPW